MPATTAKQVAKPTAKRGAAMAVDESQYVVHHHASDPEKMRAAIDRAIARARADRRTGDVCAVLREFRDNPRGE